MSGLHPIKSRWAWVLESRGHVVEGGRASPWLRRFALASVLVYCWGVSGLDGGVRAHQVPQEPMRDVRDGEGDAHDDEARAHNRLGVDFFLMGELDVAIDEFREAARLRPGFAEAHANLGVALARRGNLTGALAAWAHAQRLDPRSVPLHYHLSALVSYNYGVSLLRDGQLEQALAEWRAALRIQPDFVEAHYALGMGLLLQGRAALARSRFDEARALRPGWVAAHYQSGVASYELREWAAAERAWRAALERDPEYAPAYVNLGLVKLLEAQGAEAVKFCRKALSIDPTIPQAHFNLGLALLARGDMDEAIHAFQRSLALDPHLIRAQVALGQAWLAKGEWAKALAAWRAALRLEPSGEYAPELHYQLGIVLALLGDRRGSVAALRRAVGFRPEWIAAQYQLGVALAGLRRWSDSLRVFERVVELNPVWPQGLFALGKARYHVGDFPGAIEALRLAVEHDGEFSEAAFQLGVILRASGRLREAFDAIRRAAEKGLPAAQELLAVMYANGSGVKQHLPSAMLWWFRARQADSVGEVAMMAEDRLSEFRRRVFTRQAPEAELVEIRNGFEAIRREIRRRFAGMNGFTPERSAGVWLLQKGSMDAVPVLIAEARALDERAQERLAHLFLSGQDGLVRPYDPRILAYLLDTAREGLEQSCRVLRAGQVRDHVDARQWEEIRSVLARCGK